ncbi:MAG: hypothetical protein IKB07_11075 [Lachnospiraceae bacterium]|nr:hypothetical protein [Lachnospiraceae bacterium]
MILADVYVPSVSKHYAFRLDDNVKIGVLIEELTELICQKEQCCFIGNKEELVLCTYNANAIMSNKLKLKDYGIKDGGKLILV